MHQSLVQCFLHSVLSHYSCILLSNGYMTGFMSHGLSFLKAVITKHSLCLPFVSFDSFFVQSPQVWASENQKNRTLPLFSRTPNTQQLMGIRALLPSGSE